MPWFHVDDRFHVHHKAQAAGHAALGAWVLLGSYAADHKMDGFVPARAAHGLATRAQLNRLLAVELIEPASGGYVIHDFLDCNPGAARRAVETDRKRRWRDASRPASRDAHQQPAPAPVLAPEQAAAAVPTVGPAAAAAIEDYVLHRIQAEGRNVRSTSRYAATIRRAELANHADALAAIPPDADPVAVCVEVFGMSKSDAIRADVARVNGHTK